MNWHDLDVCLSEYLSVEYLITYTMIILIGMNVIDLLLFIYQCITTGEIKWI